MPKHIHAELIKAWAEGAEIQYQNCHNDSFWSDCLGEPKWDRNTSYRLKPKPKTIKYKRYVGMVYGAYFVGVTYGPNIVVPPIPDLVKWIDTEWQEV